MGIRLERRCCPWRLHTPNPGTDENEHRRAVADGDQDIGGSGAGTHVAMLANQVLADVGDLADPAAGAVDREMEDLLGDMTRPSNR